MRLPRLCRAGAAKRCRYLYVCVLFERHVICHKKRRSTRVRECVPSKAVGRCLMVLFPPLSVSTAVQACVFGKVERRPFQRQKGDRESNTYLRGDSRNLIWAVPGISHRPTRGETTSDRPASHPQHRHVQCRRGVYLYLYVVSVGGRGSKRPSSRYLRVFGAFSSSCLYWHHLHDSAPVHYLMSQPAVL